MFTLMILTIFLIIVTSSLILLNFFITNKKMHNREKSSPFECGFDPMSSSRLPFSIQFYLISIIFLIFDIEIIIFIPIIPSVYFNKMSNWLETTIFFVTILLLGLYIEWNDGALMWLK